MQFYALALAWLAVVNTAAGFHHTSRRPSSSFTAGATVPLRPRPPSRWEASVAIRSARKRVARKQAEYTPRQAASASVAPGAVAAPARDASVQGGTRKARLAVGLGTLMFACLSYKWLSALRPLHAALYLVLMNIVYAVRRSRLHSKLSVLDVLKLHFDRDGMDRWLYATCLLGWQLFGTTSHRTIDLCMICLTFWPPLTNLTTLVCFRAHARARARSLSLSSCLVSSPGVGV